MKAICKTRNSQFVLIGVVVEVLDRAPTPWDKQAYKYTLVSPSGSRTGYTEQGFIEHFEVIEGDAIPEWATVY